MILLFSVCSMLIALAEGQQSPSVVISQGTVIGTRATDGDYFEFHGIPYADSTSGSNRFKAPGTPPNFESNFEATRRDIKCVHALGVGYDGTEDCLVVNIFTPTTDSSRRLPVMVWVKGREFDKTNIPELSFKNFVEKDVIVVSLNYRESILGFLCLGTETAPGNAGLKDIVAGLKWVQNNIAQFGGNPENVTLFGHGSGAAAVDLVTLSPMGKGLVHRAIVQSGTALAPWAVSRDNLEYALQVAEALGHEITDIQQLSDVFTRTSVAALMGVINELELTDNALAFSPCIENQELAGGDPFLVKTPFTIIRDADFVPIPMIFGFVDNEGTIRAEEAIKDDWLERMENSFTEFIQPDLRFSSVEEQTEVVNQIKKFYFNEDGIDESEYLKYIGDTMMLVSTIREVRSRLYAFSTYTPIYLYQFSYSGTLGEQFVGPNFIEVDSASHSEELAYMFYNTPVTQITQLVRETNSNDLVIGNILSERWTSFAKTGNPNQVGGTSTENWLSYTRNAYNFLRVLTRDDIQDEDNPRYEASLLHPHPQTMTFWENIYNSYFLDAQSNWDPNDREEPDITTVEPPPTDEDTGPTEDSTPAPTDEPTTPEPDSASTAIGYTFLIISLFSVLSHFHSSQILS